MFFSEFDNPSVSENRKPNKSTEDICLGREIGEIKPRRIDKRKIRICQFAEDYVSKSEHKLTIQSKKERGWKRIRDSVKSDHVYSAHCLNNIVKLEKIDSSSEQTPSYSELCKNSVRKISNVPDMKSVRTNLSLSNSLLAHDKKQNKDHKKPNKALDCNRKNYRKNKQTMRNRVENQKNAVSNGKTHKNVEPHNTSNKFACQICGRKYRYIRGLRLHFKSCHSSREHFSCPYCSYTGNYKCTLKGHIHGHHKNVFDSWRKQNYEQKWLDGN